MNYKLTIEQFIKGSVTLEFNVNCQENELEEIKEKLIEDLYNNDFQDNEDIQIDCSFIDDYYQDKFSSKPKIINVEKN